MDVFLLFVVVLFGLAIADLVVGVSNDAVNFLNSAIGSRVSSRRNIMLVASIGVFIGATFSGGMMEVARKGIFNPEMFVFEDIMAIFLAVMLTDIILLDEFNTLGMPTSTTVSIVFELLGASVAVALIKIASNSASLFSLGSYINTQKATEIIVGIFLSVAIAFTIGAIVMWLSRLLFSFQYTRRMRFAGAIWGGLAFATLSYFLLFKGIKGASFVTDEFQLWVKENTLLLLIASFGFWTLLLQLLISVFKLNIFRGIVLFGTFSLAMAFAGNDLVNFIGVPIAGLESYQIWSSSGTAPDAFGMESLSQAVRTNPLLLLGAGVIMVATLWFSKKARSVTETEVNLGRQSEGSERFKPNFLARAMVRSIHHSGNIISSVLPPSLKARINANFSSPTINTAADAPAFDLIRASVNLTTASALIALATSLALPLSTTYVSFMVAMGTSLADKAWGRDSAVYRVSGVLNVILGWLMTALIAFVTAAFFAMLIHSFGIWAVSGLLALAIFLISRSFIYHKKKEKAKQESASYLDRKELFSSEQVKSETNSIVLATLAKSAQLFSSNLEGLLTEDLSKLRDARKLVKENTKRNTQFRQKLFTILKHIDQESLGLAQGFILAYDLEQDLQGSLAVLADACHDHVANVHAPLGIQQQKQLTSLKQDVMKYLEACQEAIRSEDSESYSAIRQEKREILNQIESLIVAQNKGLISNNFNSRNSLLFFTILLETKDVVAIAARLVKP